MQSGRILFISLSNIGDAIMTTPVLQSLHTTCPDAVIDIVADERSSELFLHCPYRGEVFHKNKKSFFRGSLALIRELRKRRYDLVIDLRTDGLAYLLRANKRLTKWQGKNYGPHAAQQHLGIIRSLHGENPIPDCYIWLNRENEEFACNTLEEKNSNRILGFGAGANWPGKIWPKENFVELTRELQDEFETLVLLGNNQDRDISDYIKKNVKLPCINMCGRTSLLQAAAIIKNLQCFVGNDSGLGHIASAVGTRTLTIFGPGNPERYHPWGNKAKWLVGEGNQIDRVSIENVANTLRIMQREIST